ncbi:NfeD family protein [Kordiimonas aquimaris]|uniref:NfeD family protein n=1 Tax=Kordiimonas aquimaris TaxID=707591 RepID=UPI0021D23E19|nr:NfeD family protein [Kordiimonas aquimaris]
MELSLNWMIDNAHWLWWSAGVLLLAGEMLVPGVYLLWLGAASALTGVVAWMLPSLGFAGHGLIFAALATISIYVGNRFVYKQSSDTHETEVNVNERRFVGKRFVVVEAIKNGRGHVQVGDSRWLAEGPDAAKGAQVHVTAVDGTVLVVEPVKG